MSIPAGCDAAMRRKTGSGSGRRIRKIAAATTALTFMLQNLAWAACNNGLTVPSGGFTPPAATNWSPLTFTGTLGSVWVPDISVNEHNNPKEPVTSGGHNWVFDQGSTTCKETDVGGANGPVTGWTIPPVNATDCITLPVFKIIGGQLVAQNFGDLPQRSSALTPTCDPTKLSTTVPNSANTYLNQLGCSLVQLATGKVQATTPQTAITYLFMAGVKSGLFAYPLTNVSVSTPGQEAGKTSGSGLIYYAATIGGQRFDSAAITPDGQYLLGGSSRTNDAVFACRNPLGDPGDPSQPLPSVLIFGATVSGTTVQCMQIGQGGDGKVKALTIGFDGQPYIGGLGFISNFTNFPACIAANTGGQSIATVFQNKSANHCGIATRNTFLNSAPDGVTALKAETQALVSHGQYLYRAIKGGAVYQAHVTATGVIAPQRQFAGGLANPTGIGFDEEATPSTMLYDDPSNFGLAARELIYKLPVCEDMP
jgi:hypothetical protein